MSCLGMKWNVNTYEISYVDVYSDLMSSLTKCSVLSQIAKLYDPLSLLSPVTIKNKIFMQLMWEKKLEWDEVISQNLHDQWSKIHNDFNTSNILKIPRFRFLVGC